MDYIRLSRCSPLQAFCILAILWVEACSNDNHAPRVEIVTSATDVAEGQQVQMSAAGISDLDGERATFTWRQSAGPQVALSDPLAAETTFVVPPLGPSDVALSFELRASDGEASATASVTLQGHPLNFVVIMTDDQTAASAAIMPTLRERVVNEGVWFENAFVTTSTCCPSRGSFLTGLYAHNHGALNNFEPRGGAGHFDDRQTVAVWLHDAGYRTGLFGKYLNGFEALVPYEPPGWDRWVVLTGEEGQDWQYDYTLIEDGVSIQYGHAPEDYSTDVLAGKVLEFLDESGQSPFFVWFTPRAPHAYFVPAERHLGLLEHEALPRPPNFYEVDVSDKPAWIRELSPEPEPDLQTKYARYLETLLAVDDALAAFLDRLEELGVLERTVIIFTSDNSLSWGEHRWIYKRSPYEEDVRVPLWVRFPSSTSSSRVDPVTLNIDLAPTIAELAGIPTSAPVDGVSYAASLRTGAWDSEARPDFLIENFDNPGDNPPEYFGVRTPAWKYVEFKNGELELYDLVSDSFELDNVVDDAANAQTRSDLESFLQELRAAGTGAAALRATLPGSLVLPSGQDAYAVTLTASGGTPPYDWLVPSRMPLPEGAALDEEGVLAVPAAAFLDDAGMPSRILTIGVRVEDQNEGWDCARIDLSVQP